MTPSSTTTPMAAPSGAPSTSGSRVEIGDTVLVKLDESIRRPLIVTQVKAGRVCGTLFCEPDDHTTSGIRTVGQTGTDPARIVGRPDRHATAVYAEFLSEGMGLGQWITRPTHLPARG